MYTAGDQNIQEHRLQASTKW